MCESSNGYFPSRKCKCGDETLKQDPESLRMSKSPNNWRRRCSSPMMSFTLLHPLALSSMVGGSYKQLLKLRFLKAHVSGAMEHSGVWKNLLSGKQAVPTVACPSCGFQVPEFRIHSHLDTCLTTLLVAEEEPAGAAHVGEVVHELSDGGEQNQNRRGRAAGARGQGQGQGRGRGRGRKRREAGERKGRDGETGRKRSRNDVGSGDNVEGGKELDAPAVDDDDDYASFYQRWEYSVAGLDDLGKSRKDARLGDLQKQELLSSGVLTIERHEVNAMVLQLDRLLADFQTTEGAVDASSLSFRGKSRVQNENGSSKVASNQVGVREQASSSSANSNTAGMVLNLIKARRWKHGGISGSQWSGLKVLYLLDFIHQGLTPRLESQLCAAQDVRTDTEKVGMGRSAAQETTASHGHHTTAISSILNFSESGGIIGGKSGVMPQSSDLMNKSARREAIEVVMLSGTKAFRGEQSVPNKGTELSSHSEPNVENSTVAESSARRPRPPSSPTAPARNPAEISGTSPGLQACPICNCPFPPETNNREINEHIDQCLTEMACQFD